jgi:hypothetical protein
MGAVGAGRLGWSAGVDQADLAAGRQGAVGLARFLAKQPTTDLELELRQHQQRRRGWLEANAHLGPQYRQVVRALAWQRRATGLAAEAGRPGYILEALGPVPESTRGRRAWRQAAAEIEHYRRSYHITDLEQALGPEPHERAQRADRQRARTAIDRVHTKQCAADRTRDAQPISEHSSPPRPREQRGRPGPERAAG